MKIEDIADLFDEFYLVDEPAAPVVAAPVQPAKEKEKSPEIRCEGSNKKNIIFLCPSALSNDARSMIVNMITRALKFSMDDLALISLEQNPDVSWSTVKETLAPKHVVSWGCDTFLTGAGIPVKRNEPLAGSTMTILSVEDPERYIADPQLKKILWDAIQKLFA